MKFIYLEESKVLLFQETRNTTDRTLQIMGQLANSVASLKEPNDPPTVLKGELVSLAVKRVSSSKVDGLGLQYDGCSVILPELSSQSSLQKVLAESTFVDVKVALEKYQCKCS